MVNPFKAIRRALDTRQSMKDVDIEAELSKYHMYTGHYFNKKKLQHDLHISDTEFTNILVGDKSIPMSRYNQIIDYIKRYVKQAENQANHK